MSHVKDLVIIQLKSALIYLPAGFAYAAGITFLVLVLAVIWRFRLHRKVDRVLWWRLPIGFLFIAYIYCVLQLTLFSRKSRNYEGIDWRFLVRWNENDSQKAFLIANIIMFIPFGVLFPMFGKVVRHILVVLPIAAACSIGIETLQLKYQLGSCQLDDVVANSVGFLIGGLFLL